MSEAIAAPAPGTGIDAMPPGGPVTPAAPVAAASPAPEPAPAPPPAPAPAAPAAAPAAPTFEPTGNANLDYALTFIGGLGFGLDHPAVKAAEAGNFGILSVELAKLGDKAKGFEAVLKLAEAGLGEVKAAEQAKFAANLKKVHEAVGGEENWKQVEAWAKTAAEPEELEAVNQGLAIGGVVAEAVAEYLNLRYQRASGTTVEPQSITNGANTTPASEPLTQAGYFKEVGDLRRAQNGRLDGTPAYAALQAKYARLFAG